MSGHSKWHQIRHQKGITDAKRGKIFTRHAKLIEIAARDGGDPTLNAKLATAIINAKADNLPKDNIERAIKKGTGELAGDQIVERVYEGYGPSGVALLITALTDNVNRTIANLRHTLDKYGGKVADSGSVAFQFERVGQIEVGLGELAAETAELAAIEAGASDLEVESGTLYITTPAAELAAVKEKLTTAGLTISKAELAYQPLNTIAITDAETAQKILTLVEKLEEDDDVDTVYGNFEIPAELMPD